MYPPFIPVPFNHCTDLAPCLSDYGPLQVLTHRQLLREIWGIEDPHDNQYLRVYVRQLRKKIEPDPSRPTYILTEPGVGYRLNAALD